MRSNTLKCCLLSILTLSLHKQKELLFQVFVKVRNLRSGQEFDWTKEKFLSREYVMKEMYLNFENGLPWEVAEVCVIIIIYLLSKISNHSCVTFFVTFLHSAHDVDLGAEKYATTKNTIRMWSYSH